MAFDRVLPEISGAPTKFLGLQGFARLEPRPANATFPEDVAAKHRVLAGGDLRPHPLRPEGPVPRDPAARRRLADWYAACPVLIGEDDGLDTLAKAGGPRALSISGQVPTHLAFDPAPSAAVLKDSLSALLGPATKLGKDAEGGIRTRWQTTSFSTTIYPWCTAGVIMRSFPPYTQEYYAGTGFMFGGRVMMTARHIFADDIHGALDQTRYTFIPGFDSRSQTPEPFGRASVTNVRGKSDNSGWGWNTVTGWDYAVCRLDWRIGDLTGTMGVACYGDSDDYRDMYVNSVGYPGFNGNIPTLEVLARIRDVDGSDYERELETKNFAGPGWSGGPLFGYVGFTGETRVVGVCSGLETADSFVPPYQQCVWAGGQRFVNLAEWSVQNWWT